MIADRCHWTEDEDGTEILIPMCMGCAVNGVFACTCNTPESRIEAAESGRAEAERQVVRLREKSARRLQEQIVQWRTISALRARIRELEARLANQSS